ncbi:MAG TPA: BamA/TamA family outer membrane protein, partial [Polyangiales bacterium]|nr:BamA/TamA family outer membrane protein [Polyangiales bacterium]
MRLLVIVLLQLLAAGVAHAELPKRELPDYDGRPEITSTGDTLLVIPRVLLSPLYLVSEYVVRRPLGFLVTAAERSNLPKALYDFFVFGPDHSTGILPIAFVDFGFYPSLGLFFFDNDAFWKGHDLRIRGSTWGEHWLAGSWSDIFHLDPLTDLTFVASAVRRPDYRFYGIGSDTVEADRSRYGASRLEAGLQLELKLGGLSRFESGAGVRRVHFHRGAFDDDPTLERNVGRERYAEPDGYALGYTLFYNQAALALDTRRARPAPGSGVRVELRAEQLSQVEPRAVSGFLRYGGTAGGFLDLGSHGRVVSLSVALSFIDPLTPSASVPFTELAAIGGGELMRGFTPGRLLGRSAAVATLRYRWPIWVWLDGSIQIATGNVFDAHLSNFD